MSLSKDIDSVLDDMESDIDNICKQKKSFYKKMSDGAKMKAAVYGRTWLHRMQEEQRQMETFTHKCGGCGMIYKIQYSYEIQKVRDFYNPSGSIPMNMEHDFFFCIQCGRRERITGKLENIEVRWYQKKSDYDYSTAGGTASIGPDEKKLHKEYMDEIWRAYG